MYQNNLTNWLVTCLLESSLIVSVSSNRHRACIHEWCPLPRTPQKQNTRERILDTAERLVQTRGFNAFSFADIAEALHVTKASLHYHFPTKADLGRQLIERYIAAFTQALSEIDQSSENDAARIGKYIDLYRSVLRNNRMCLCGMLAAEFATLPKPMKVSLTKFFDTNEQWLIEVLASGRATKCFRFAGEPSEFARYIVGTLEGAMMLARSYGQTERFDASVNRMLTVLGIRD